MYGISKQFGVSIEDLMLENNLSNTNIVVGSSLKIPTMGSINNYIVKKGDTLYSISKKFGISVNELKLLNSLNNNTLYIGQVLNIPSNDQSSDFNYYEVNKGDTLYSIAKKYDTTVDSLINLNNLNNSSLFIGQLLVIPSGSINNVNNNLYYIVQPGDTLYSISKKYNISVDNLINNNNLSNNKLVVGQYLIINPIYTNSIELGSSCFGDSYEEPKFIVHTVKKGDNLYNISKMYGVSVDSIIKLNNLSNNNLSIGQTLKIKESD